MKNYLNLLLMLLIASSQIGHAQMSTVDSSQIRGPTSVASKVQCTTFTLNGKTIGLQDPSVTTAYNIYMQVSSIYTYLASIDPTNAALYLSLADTYSGIASSLVTYPTVFDTNDCISYNGTNTGMAAAGAVVAMFGAGDLGIMCPANYPFYRSYSETWGFGLGNGGINPSATCCKVPPNKVANSTAWTTATPDAYLGGDGVCNAYTSP